MSDIRWLVRDGSFVLQRHVRIETQVPEHRHYVSSRWGTEVSYEWQDIPVEIEEDSPFDDDEIREMEEQADSKLFMETKEELDALKAEKSTLLAEREAILGRVNDLIEVVKSALMVRSTTTIWDLEEKVDAVEHVLDEFRTREE